MADYINYALIFLFFLALVMSIKCTDKLKAIGINENTVSYTYVSRHTIDHEEIALAFMWDGKVDSIPSFPGKILSYFVLPKTMSLHIIAGKPYMAGSSIKEVMCPVGHWVVFTEDDFPKILTNSSFTSSYAKL